MVFQKGFSKLTLFLIVAGLMVLGGAYYMTYKSWAPQPSETETSTTPLAQSGAMNTPSATQPTTGAKTQAVSNLTDKISGDSGYILNDGEVYFFWTTTTSEGSRVEKSRVVDADPGTFVTASLHPGVNLEADADPYQHAALSALWGKDAKNIYKMGVKVSPHTPSGAVDIRTFEPVSDRFFKDIHAVYEIETMGSENIYKQWSDIDGKSFVLINRQYAKDKNAVYYIDFYSGLARINAIDPSTFRVIGECSHVEVYGAYYVADAHTVVALDKPIPGADPKTFKIVGTIDENPGGMTAVTSYATDGTHVYKGCGELVPNGSPAQCTADNLKGCEGSAN